MILLHINHTAVHFIRNNGNKADGKFIYTTVGTMRKHKTMIKAIDKSLIVLQPKKKSNVFGLTLDYYVRHLNITIR